MQSLIKFWDRGIVVERSQRPIVYFIITKFSDIHEKVIPFFEKYHMHELKVWIIKIDVESPN